jgi:predicted deacylase
MAEHGPIVVGGPEVQRSRGPEVQPDCIDDAFGNSVAAVRAPRDGMVIGCTRSPLVNHGDAVAHIAELA